MLLLRKIHLYLGTLFAPTIIFFAFSGTLQTFGLHEAEKTDPHQPPAWIVTLAALHKDQHLPRAKIRKPSAAPSAESAVRANAGEHAEGTAAPEHEHAGPASDAGVNGAAGLAAPPEPDMRQTALKIFVLLMATGLVVSAVLGILIALKNGRTRRTALLMLIAGVVLPTAMLL